jgi:hypothetical protein
MFFLWKETDLRNTEKTLHVYITLSNIKYMRVKNMRNSKLMAR